MAYITFDKYNQPEVPPIYLANPDGKQLFSLETIYNRKMELRFNTLSTFSFTAPSKIDGISVDYYPFLEHRRLVVCEGIGVFMITNIKIDSDGIVETKEVTCQSAEVKIADKKLNLFTGYRYFYFSSGSANLLEELLTYIPDWSLSDTAINYLTTTGSGLATKFREFNVTDKTLYDFMVNEVSQTYQCVFTFDTLNKEINVTKVEDATTPTDIFISFDNLMKSFEKEEAPEELCTALTVLGGDDLAINLVNPLGDNTIYNFDYYKNTNWMEQSLIDNINTWENNIATYETGEYSGSIIALQETTGSQTTASVAVADLNNLYSACIVYRDGKIQANEDTAEVTNWLDEISASKVVATAEYDAYTAEVNRLYACLDEVSGSLSITNVNNFTTEEQSILSNFIIGGTYTNTNFIQSNVSYYDTMMYALELYEQGKSVLAKISQPRYTFTADSVNFLFLKEYQTFINQLAMGCTITIELENGTYIVPALLGVDYNYDDPNDFKLILSNRFRLDDEKFQYSDIFSSVVDAAATTNFNSLKWTNASDNVSGAYPVVKVVSTSSMDDFPVFSDNSGYLVKDSGGKYSNPTTFTPELISLDKDFEDTDATCTYSVIGRNLFFNLSISGNHSGTGTSAVYILMPVQSKTSGAPAYFDVYCENITLTGKYYKYLGIMKQNTREMYIYKSGSSWYTPLLGSDFVTGGSFSMAITGTYFLD